MYIEAADCVGDKLRVIADWKAFYMSDVVVVFAGFFGLTLIAHVTLLSFKKIRSSEYFWVAVDYVWLGTAVVGLIFATGEVKRLGINDEIKLMRSDALSKFNSERSHASHIAQILQGELDKDGGQSGITWFRNLAEDLDLGLDSGKWERYVSQNNDTLIEHPPGTNPSKYVLNPLWENYKLNPNALSPSILKEGKVAVLQLKIIWDMKIDLDRKTKELEVSNIESWFKYLSPLLLSFALAIRFTRTTADLLKKKESGKRVGSNSESLG
jgi:hypothetical protein